MTFNAVMFKPPAADDRSRFKTLALGSTRDQVIKSIGPAARPTGIASRGVEPPPPANAACTYAPFEENGTAMVERYCTRSDLHIEKTRFFLPGS